MPERVFFYTRRIVFSLLAGIAVRRFCLLFGLFIYTELVFQILTGTISIEFYRVGLFLFICATLLTFITLCLPKFGALLLSELAVFFVSLLSLAQFLYNRIFHEFFTIDKMSVGGDAITQFGDILLTAMQGNIPGITALLLPVFVLPVLYRLHRFPASERLRLQVRYAIIPVILLCALRYSLLIPAAADVYSPYAARYGQADLSRISS